MKKFLELFIVVWTLTFLIYFLLYMFYFDNMCNSIKQDAKWDYIFTIKKIWSCKSSIVCWINKIETNKQNIIVDWSCDKKINSSLEFNTYMNYFTEFYSNILNKINKNDNN